MPTSELLGICVVYLGGLNYFFPVDEKCPIVSKIGTTGGELHVQITPYISTTSNSTAAASAQARAVVKPEQAQDDTSDGFMRYERAEIDNAEEQVYEFMDRTLQYRVCIHALHNLKRTRKFSHVYVRYAFFKSGSALTKRQAIRSSQDDDEEDGHAVRFQHERRFAVDVNDALVKYVTSNNLTLESFTLGEEVVAELPQESIPSDFRLFIRIVSTEKHCKTTELFSLRNIAVSTEGTTRSPTMAQLSSDVDAIWKEMQQEQTPSRLQADVNRLLRRSVARCSSKAVKGKKRADGGHKVKMGVAVKKTSTLSTAAQSMASLDIKAEQQQQQHASAKPFNLQRELNRLADERSSVRKKAALALEDHLLKPCEQITVVSSEQMLGGDHEPEDSTFGEIAKPLFKRFNDPIEKVRDVCIRIVTLFIAREQDLLRFIPYLMPAITNRINSQYGYDEENQQFTRDQFLHDAFKRGRIFVEEDQVSRLKLEEPSEEIRLLFLGLLAALLENAFQRNASSILHAYMFDILVILVSGLHDNFHEVNIKACEILRAISNNMVSVMKHFSVAIVRAAKDLLLHRLARVRIAAIDTIRALVTCPNRDKCKGSGTEAIVDLIGHRDENVIPISAFYTSEIRLNYFAKLDQDANPLVRKMFFDMISDWITNLPDRYDHESRLMPYLLSAVSDKNDDISHNALQTLAFLGTRYEQEHGEEVLEMKQYGVDGKNPSYNYRKRLPPPFLDARPSLGTRLYVRGRARRFLNPILRELDNWQSKTRGHAVRLLKTIIVYCEETITVDVHLLLQTLLCVWREPEIANELKIVAELVGRFAAPDTYMSLILARIRGDSEVVAGGVVSPEQTATGMEVLCLLMEGSLDRMLLPHIHDILETVSAKHILDFENGDAKHALGKLVQYLTCLLERKCCLVSLHENLDNGSHGLFGAACMVPTGRGSEAVSAYFLQHGRLTTMERVHDRLFEITLVVSRTQNSKEAAVCAANTLETLVRLESRKSMTELFDTHFQKSFARVAVALNAMTAVHWTPKCCEQLLLEELLHGTSLETILSELPVLEQLFQNALVPLPSADDDALLLSNGEPVKQEKPTRDVDDQKRSGTERSAAYSDILQALLARVELEPSAAAPARDVAQSLEALQSFSKAAAA